MERSVALVGYGLAGAVFHGPLIEATPGLRVSAVATSNPERAQQAARAHPGAEIVSGPDEIWAGAEAYDAVVIATPNSSHAPLARRAIELGLPVVVDKPLAPDSATAEALVEEARGAGVPLTVFLNRRWDSDFLTLRRLIGDGTLGRVHRFESRFERFRPELRDEAWRETTSPADGGGVLLDLGPHLIDQALLLFGPAAEVHGEVAAVRGGAADDDAFVAIAHESGVNSHIWASSVAPSPGPRFRVQGSEAGFVSPGLDGQEAALRAGELPGDGGWGEEPRERWGSLVRGDDAEPEPVRPENGDWPAFYEMFAAALSGEGPMPVGPADAVAGLRVIELARGD